jgi:hypothetical protein
MPESIVKKSVILELNEEEVRWLRAIMQNPLDAVDTESSQDARLRKAFFEALSEPSK